MYPRWKTNRDNCSREPVKYGINSGIFQAANVFGTASMYSDSFLLLFQKPAPHLFPCFCLLPYPIIIRRLPLPTILLHTQRPFLLDGLCLLKWGSADLLLPPWSLTASKDYVSKCILNLLHQTKRFDIWTIRVLSFVHLLCFVCMNITIQFKCLF
jgi:hypothetical protein